MKRRVPWSNARPGVLGRKKSEAAHRSGQRFASDIGFNYHEDILY